MARMICPRCNQEIDKHEAGYETDVCVRTVVFDDPQPYHDIEVVDEVLLNKWASRVKYYSTDITAAWQVEERIAELGLDYDYGVALARMLPPIAYKIAHASPLDRCKAALKACTVDK